MSDKPSYLGLLNAIAVAEADAEKYLSAWAEVTPRDDVRQVLSTVALREGEHAKAFAKRICELGFEVRSRPDPTVAERTAIAGRRDLSDRQKFEQLQLVREDDGDSDVFDPMFGDKSIDIQTGALLGRYIAEERDSGRLFRACYEQLCAAEAPSEPRAATSNGAVSPGADIGALEGRLNRIEELLQQLVDRLG